MNCFHWNSSDIDYIVVIEKELSEEQKLSSEAEEYYKAMLEQIH
jgi:hypothetical protein